MNGPIDIPTSYWIKQQKQEKIKNINRSETKIKFMYERLNMQQLVNSANADINNGLTAS